MEYKSWKDNWICCDDEQYAMFKELNDKIESLKEDIIRLDKCLSNRQCVQLERIKEEDNG